MKQRRNSAALIELRSGNIYENMEKTQKRPCFATGGLRKSSIQRYCTLHCHRGWGIPRGSRRAPAGVVGCSLPAASRWTVDSVPQTGDALIIRCHAGALICIRIFRGGVACRLPTDCVAALRIVDDASPRPRSSSSDANERLMDGM